MPLIDTNFIGCTLNESCAFETTVKDWWSMVQEMNYTQLLSVKWEKHPASALHHGRGF